MIEPYKEGKLRWQFVFGFIIPVVLATLGVLAVLVWWQGLLGLGLWMLIIFAIAAAGGDDGYD